MKRSWPHWNCGKHIWEMYAELKKSKKKKRKEIKGRKVERCGCGGGKLFHQKVGTCATNLVVIQPLPNRKGGRIDERKKKRGGNEQTKHATREREERINQITIENPNWKVILN